MNEERDHELQTFEIWERRGRFFSEVVVGMFLRPTLSIFSVLVGLAAVIVLVVNEVADWPPYAAGLSLVGAPGVAHVVDAIRRRPGE